MSAFSKIVVCFLAQQNFKNEFPDYESDIYGIEKNFPDEEGNKYLKPCWQKNKK